MSKSLAHAESAPIHNAYPLRTVSRLTGLSADVIRVWERRYSVVSPQRGPRGARLYTNEEIHHLKSLAMLVEQGRAIGDIAKLPVETLQALLRSEPSTEEQPSDAPQSEDAPNALTVRFFEAVESFDVDAASTLLADAALALGLRSFLSEVITPLLIEVGTRWADGRLSIAREHMISKVLRDFLGSFARIRRVTGPPKVLLATPQGERHELGLMVAATVLLENGVSVLTLGADLPASDIAAAANEVRPHAVLLAVLNTDNRKSAIASIREIRKLIPIETEIWLAGEDREAVSKGLAPSTIRTIADLPALEQECVTLSAWTDGSR